MGKNKRSRGYYIQSAKRQKYGSSLCPGMQGFLCTCSGHERDCVREAYNILNQFADQIYGKEEIAGPENCNTNLKVTEGELTDDDKGKQEKIEDKEDSEPVVKQKTEESPDSASEDEVGDSDSEFVDIDAAVKADVVDLKKQNERKHKQQRRFQQVQSGAKNCIFIRTTLQDPLPLSVAVMDDIIQTQKQQTKRLLRMVPVQKTCKAHAEDIVKAVEELAKSHFEKEWKTFYILIKVRNNNSVKREALTGSLVEVMQDMHPNMTPDMVTPDVVLNVDVIKNTCCLSFLPEYLTKYGKYNLVVLANKGKEEEQLKEASKESVKKDENCSEKAKICEEKVEESDANHADDTIGDKVCTEVVDKTPSAVDIITLD